MKVHIMSACVIVAALAAVFAAHASGAPEHGVAMKNPFFAMDTCTKDAYPTGKLSIDQQLDMLKELGYKGIAWTACEPAELKAVCDGAKKRGLKLFAHYMSATLKKSGLEFDPRLKPTMDALKGTGTLIWIHIGSPEFAHSSPEGDDLAAQGLREMADYAAARKLRIALYPHVGEWIERFGDALRVAKKVDKKNLGVTFNLCHALFVGDEDKIFSLLDGAGPKLFMVTLNGADANAAGTSWNRLIQTLDKGTYDLIPLLKHLKELHYPGPIGLQGFGIQGDIKENLQKSMAGWRRLTAQ